jgi:hypothetical protein
MVPGDNRIQIFLSSGNMNSKITVYNVLIAALMIPEMSRSKKNAKGNGLILQTRPERISGENEKKQI